MRRVAQGEPAGADHRPGGIAVQVATRRQPVHRVARLGPLNVLGERRLELLERHRSPVANQQCKGGMPNLIVQGRCVSHEY